MSEQTEEPEEPAEEPAKRNTKRIRGVGRACYHVTSRVVDKRKIFDPRDKEFFRRQMRILERFSEIRVIAYCFMGNHFHLLLSVPDKSEIEPLTVETLRAFLPEIHGEETRAGAEQELERALEQGWADKVLARYEERRGNLGAFMKSLKHRVTLRMNRKLERVGTLWEGRYRSVLVEGRESALMAVAAYIDLNPVRAGLVEKPEDYRWSGYAEAMTGRGRGAALAREGLMRAVGTAMGGWSEEAPDWEAAWKKFHADYRRLLYAKGEEWEGDSQSAARRGMSREEARKVSRGSGKLPLPELLRRRVRYLVDGAVLGSEEFLEEVFEREKAGGRFGPKRESGARKMQGGDWEGLRVLRDLKVRLFD